MMNARRRGGAEVEPSDADTDFQRFSVSKVIAGHPSTPKVLATHLPPLSVQQYVDETCVKDRPGTQSTDLTLACGETSVSCACARL